MRLTRRIYSKLKRIILDQDVDIKIRTRLANATGLMEPDKDAVIIHGRQNSGEKSITLLHELLHYEYPHIEDEEIIENSAKKIYSELSRSEKGFLEFIVSPGEKI